MADYLDENLVHLVSNIQENSFFFSNPVTTLVDNVFRATMPST